MSKRRHMTIRSAGFFILIGLLAQPVWTLAATNENIVRQLGGSTRFCGPLATKDDVARLFRRDRADIEEIMSMAELSSIAEQLIETVLQGELRDVTVDPGTRLEWMALRRNGKPDLIRNARWEGDYSFDAFAAAVETPSRRYEFLIPKICGNLSLLQVTPVPVAVIPPRETERQEPPPEREDPQADDGARAMQARSEPERDADWYVAADVGYVGISDGSYDFIGAAVIPHRAEFDGGLTYSVQAGRRFDELRVEVELARRSNDADRFGSILDIVPARGSLDATSLMLNGVYDFPIGERFQPYVGAGIGAARVKADGVRKAVTDPDRTGALFGSDDRFAWQLFAGISWRLDPRWSLVVNYRYIDAGDARIQYGVGCDAGGAQCIFSDDLDQEYTAHSLSVGVRYDF